MKKLMGGLWVGMLVILGGLMPVWAQPSPQPALTPTPIPLQDQQFDVGILLQETPPNVDQNVLAGYLDAASNQLALNWIRVEIRWDYVETEPNVYNWGVWDTLFQLTSQYNLKVLVNLSGSPLWLREPNSDPAALAPPQDKMAFATFAADLIRRYPNQIHALEVWQRMNLQSAWATSGGLDPNAYLELLTLTATATRAVNPDLIIISGALQSTITAEGVSMDNLVYFDSLLAGGLLSWVNCVGVAHSGYNVPADAPYDAIPPDETTVFRGPFDNPHPSWSFYSTLTNYIRKVNSQGQVVPLCVTRFGWGTSQDLEAVAESLLFTQDNTLDEQALWLTSAIQIMEESGFVWLAFINNLNVGAENGFDPQIAGTYYSLIRPNFAPAPAWSAIAALNFRARP